jgi:hypothetical protein
MSEYRDNHRSTSRGAGARLRRPGRLRKGWETASPVATVAGRRACRCELATAFARRCWPLGDRHMATWPHDHMSTQPHGDLAASLVLHQRAIEDKGGRDSEGGGHEARLPTQLPNCLRNAAPLSQRGPAPGRQRRCRPLPSPSRHGLPHSAAPGKGVGQVTGSGPRHGNVLQFGGPCLSQAPRGRCEEVMYPQCECRRIGLVKADGSVGKCRVGVRRMCVVASRGICSQFVGKMRSCALWYGEDLPIYRQGAEGADCLGCGLRNGQISSTTCPPLCSQNSSVPQNPQCPTPGTSIQSATRPQPK